MSSRQKFKISFEEVEEQVLVPEEVDCSTALIDMGQAQSEVKSMDNQIEAIVSDADTLDKIADIMESNVDVGLNPQTGEVIHLVTESIYTKYGLNVKPVPSFESYTEVSKVMFTGIAIESIKEGLARVWSLIVAAMKAAYNAVVEFLKKIFKAITGVKQKAEKLTETVKGISFDKQPSVEEILSSGNVANEDIEQVQKKKLSASAITLIFTDKTDAPSVFRTCESLIKQLSELPAIYEAVDKSIQITQTLIKEFGDKKSVDNFSYPTFTNGLTASKEDGKYHGEILPGSMALIVKGASHSSNFKGLEAVHAMRSTAIYIGPFDEAQHEFSHKAIPVLNKTSLDKILEDSIRICTAVDKLESQANKLQNGFKALTKDASEFKVFSDDPTAEMKQAFNDLKGVVTSIKTICSTGLPSVLSYSLRVSNALVDYCYVSSTCYNKVKLN